MRCWPPAWAREPASASCSPTAPSGSSRGWRRHASARSRSRCRLSHRAPNSRGCCATPIRRCYSWAVRSPATTSSSESHDALPGLADGDAAIALAAVPYLRRVHVWPDCDRAWASPWPGSTDPVAPLTGSAEQEVGPADELVLVTTSGTTALPKSVAHTHGSLVRHAAVLAAPSRRHLRRPHLLPDAVLLGRRH